MTGSVGEKLVIVGDSKFAQIAYEYFTYDSPFEVVAFAVEADYRQRDEFCGLPVVDFEELVNRFDPTDHSVYVALVYTQLNRLRTRLAAAAKQLGYALASYVSSAAFVWRNVELGEHCFIFEHNVIQPFATIGNNVVLWSTNHIGHHARIGDNCFLTSHVVVAGSVVVGANSFLGANATIANDLTVGRDSWIGPDVTVTRDTAPGSVFRPAHSERREISSYELFGVEP